MGPDDSIPFLMVFLRPSQGSALLKQLDALITLLQVGKSWVNWVNWMKRKKRDASLSFVHGEAGDEAKLDLFNSLVVNIPL